MFNVFGCFFSILLSDAEGADGYICIVTSFHNRSGETIKHGHRLPSAILPSTLKSLIYFQFM